MNDSITVGLDIGTTKVCVVVGSLNDLGELQIIGVGSAPSDGLYKGVVSNFEQTAKTIIKAVEDAEMMSGVDIEDVYAGIAGGHIQGLTSKGVIAVQSKDRIITEKDVNRVIDAAKALALPLGREVIHIIPQAFRIDEREGFKDPIGMQGVRLEADVHIITAAVISAQNIVTSVTKAGFDVNDIVLEPLASAKAVLSRDEKEMGVVLVDIGGGTSDVLIYHNNSIIHTSVLSIGGKHVTADISMGLRTPKQYAEDV
ncbi:MAG: cell division protein FtsA, partial [Actinomycetia bacterium]|nr:cell division protein FtsA [Actinomycetes bacterium]